MNIYLPFSLSDSNSLSLSELSSFISSPSSDLLRLFKSSFSFCNSFLASSISIEVSLNGSICETKTNKQY